MDRFFVLVILLTTWAMGSGSLHAQPFDTPLENTQLEQRAQNLFRELRCMVCQNQAIHDSDAPLAKDMRQLVREKIGNGETDRQIMLFLEERYGEFVLMRPRFAPHTWLLWGTPVLALLLGAFGGVRLLSRRQKWHEPLPLSAEEEKRIERILKNSQKQ